MMAIIPIRMRFGAQAPLIFVLSSVRARLATCAILDQSLQNQFTLLIDQLALRNFFA